MKDLKNLSLDTKVITQLTDAQLDSLQGGAGPSDGVCTYYTGTCQATK